MKNLSIKRKFYGFIIILWILVCLPRDGAAALFEQMAIETRAQSLAGSVTADPMGPLSAHFNPAGLDRVRGTELTMGTFVIPVLNIKGRFTQSIDPSTGEPWAPFGGWFNNGIDPLGGQESKTTPTAELPFLGSPGGFLAAPNLGIAYHAKGSPFAFGFAVYVPVGVGEEHTNPQDPYRFLGKRMSLLRAVMAPTISYRITKTLSVGASFGLGLVYMGFDTRMRAPNELVALTGVLGEATTGLEIPIISELTFPPPWFGGGLSPYEDMGGLKFFAEDNLTTSFNVGILWEPFSWLSLGAVYQSESKADLKGKYKLDYSERMQKTINWLGSSPTTIIIAAMLDLPTYCPEMYYGNMSLEVIFPARAQVGIKLQPHRRIKFLVDAQWVQWSSWEAMNIVFDRDVELFRLAKLMGYQGGDYTLGLKNNFKDTIHFSFGLELEPIDNIFLRFGYEARPSSIDRGYFGPIPMGDMKLYSIGLGAQFKPHDRRLHGITDLSLHGLTEITKQLLKPDKVDLGFTYMESSYQISANESVNFNSTDFTKIIYNPFAGLDYENKIEAYIFSFNLTWMF